MLGQSLEKPSVYLRPIAQTISSNPAITRQVQAIISIFQVSKWVHCGLTRRRSAAASKWSGLENRNIDGKSARIAVSERVRTNQRAHGNRIWNKAAGKRSEKNWKKAAKT
jgi:hypothetical protein